MSKAKSNHIVFIGFELGACLLGYCHSVHFQRKYIEAHVLFILKLLKKMSTYNQFCWAILVYHIDAFNSKTFTVEQVQNDLSRKTKI